MTSNPGGFSVGGSVGGDVNNVQGNGNRVSQNSNTLNVSDSKFIQAEEIGVINVITYLQASSEEKLNGSQASIEKREGVNTTKEEAEKLIKDIEQFLLEAHKQQEVIISEHLRKERVASPQERDKWNEFITSSMSLGERAMIEYKVKFKDKVIKMREKVLSELENNTKQIDQITLIFYQNPVNLNNVQEILINLEEITSKLKTSLK